MIQKDKGVQIMIAPYVGGEFKITSIYGYRQLAGVNAFHSGIDCVGISSKQVCAVAPGKVVVSQIVTDKTNATWEWGNYIAVAGDDGNVIYYCHMSERIAKVGQRVKVGDVLGIEGNTGYSFGSHLHLEVRKGNAHINAAEYINAPNEVGTYSTEENEEMNEKIIALENEIKELKKLISGTVYNKIDDIPSWAKPTIEKLIKKGILNGDGNGNLNIPHDMMRTLIILDRTGVFDK